MSNEVKIEESESTRKRDPEILAMDRIVRILEDPDADLSTGAKDRITEWLRKRYTQAV